MPTLYGALGSPFVRKAIVALTEKGIAYDHDPVVPFAPTAEYLKISPLGKIPAFRDGDRTLADSSVIIAYLERTHPEPSLYPNDPYEYARALWFEEFGDGGLTPVLGAKIFFPRVIAPRFFNQPPDEVAIKKVIDEEVPPLFDYLEKEIGDKQFLIAKWLGQKLNCTGLHGAHRHRNIAVTGDEDDWYIDVGLGELALKIEPAQSRQAHIKHEATGRFGQLGLQELGC